MVVCFDLRHASVRPDYTDINLLVDRIFIQREYARLCDVLYTTHSCCHLFRFVMLHCKVMIELIEHRFFSMNDKFQAIVDSLKVPIGNDHLYVRRLSTRSLRLRSRWHLRQFRGLCPSCSRDQSFRSLSKRGAHRSTLKIHSMSTYFEKRWRLTTAKGWLNCAALPQAHWQSLVVARVTDDDPNPEICRLPFAFLHSVFHVACFSFNPYKTHTSSTFFDLCSTFE
jgi:hypothetical protein